ncbi:hypothetical protein LJB97_05455 [Parabacteroides sp. OttesenSCG-928-O15]|nr:hypothetical protein [Parabacteroides sp. OttesenSCG-928-O15]
MKRNIFILFLLSALCFAGCQDEKDPVIETNSYGSNKEICGDYKISRYTISNKLLEIKEKLGRLDHHLYSIESGREYTFEGRLTEVGDMLRVEMLIPLREELADGEYRLYFSTEEEERLVASFHIMVANEMVSAVAAEKIDYGSKFKGSGTSLDPYIVEKLSTLFNLLHKDSLQHAAGLHFRQSRLYQQIDMQGSDWEGRGHTPFPFAGHYDGDGVILDRLVHRGEHNAEKDCYVGLFSELLDGAVVENVHFTNVDITRPADYVGVVAGYSSGDVTLNNISISGHIIEALSSVGGLIGRAGDGDVSIRDIKSNLYIEGTDYVGGLIGEASKAMLIIHQVDFERSSQIIAKRWVGGLIGCAKESYLDVNHISAVYRTDDEDDDLSTMKAEGVYLGFIAGYLSHDAAYSYVKNVRCKVPLQGNGYVGGLFGHVEGRDGVLELRNIKINGHKIQNSSNYTGGVAGHWTGLGLRIDSLEMQSSLIGEEYTGGVFGKIWSIPWEKDKITRVMIEPADGITGTNHVGGAFGSISSGLPIVPAHTKAFSFSTTTSINGANNVGGFAGSADNSHFEGDVYFDKNIIKTTDITGESLFGGKVNEGSKYETSATDVGGLFGRLFFCTVSHVMADGVVKGKHRVGGIVGLSTSATLKSIARKGEEVRSSDGNVGGICGTLSNESGNLDLLVNFSSVVGNGDSHNTGGIIGYTDPNVITITNAINRGNVSGGESIGGIVGKIVTNDKGHDRGSLMAIKESVNYGAITGSYKGGSVLRGLGGIAGAIEYCVEIAHCANHGPVTADTNTTYNGVGGIVGVAGHDGTTQSNDNQINVHHCCNTGTVTTKMGTGNKKWAVGGVVGRLYFGYPGDLHSTRVHNCYNTGKVVGDSNKDNGGIVGTIENYGHVNECVNIGKVDHGNGGVGTHTDVSHEIKNVYILKGSGGNWAAYQFSTSDKGKKGTFSHLTFSSDYWTIDTSHSKNDGYPYLSNCYYQFRKE